jgi:hypothetical protein
MHLDPSWSLVFKVGVVAIVVTIVRFGAAPPARADARFHAASLARISGGSRMQPLIGDALPLAVLQAAAGSWWWLDAAAIHLQLQIHR